ncbi:MAG TPA: cation:proton antiporter [Thermoplasmata archaeon]|nr:cation:proton antiporter [Thermoplasmata archaeon]
MDISILIYVLLIIAFAKMMGEIVTRFNQPSIVGELLAGIVLGPFLLGEIIPQLQDMYTDTFIQGLADLGMLLLMLYVGMEFSPKKLLASSVVGVAIAAVGVILPFSFGFVAGIYFGLEGVTLIFVSLAMSVTALPITIRILKDMEVVNTGTAGKIISAALITDLSLLFAMGLVLGEEEISGTQSTDSFFFLAMGYILFFAIAIIVGKFFIPHLDKILTWMRTGEAAFAMAIGIAILFAVIADLVHLPSFVGAFIAGMILRETGTRLRVWTRVEDILSGITLGFMAPIFFVLIGFTVDFQAVFGNISTLMLFISLLSIAIVGKFIGSFIPAKLSGISTNESMAIASMMIANGAMELVFANLALQQGIIGEDLFSVLVLMAFVSTILAPILFKHYFNKAACKGEIYKDGETDTAIEESGSKL